MYSKRMFSLIGLLFVSLVAMDAFAQAQPRQHPAFGKRNIVTPKNTLEINAGPLGNYGGGGVNFTIFNVEGIDIDPIIGLNVGGAYGVHNDLSLGAMVLPITISPDFNYNNPSVFGRYRFLHGNFEMAGEVSFILPVNEGTDFTLRAGIPVRNRSDSLRIDAGLFVQTDFDNFGLSIPLSLFFNVTPDIFAGVITGFNVSSFDPFTANIPIGIGAGYTLQGANGPTGDISVSVGIPGLLLDDSDLTDTFSADIISINVGGTFFVYL